MKLDEFLEKYDKEGSIVLLEGKRKVREEDRDKLIALGKLLGEKTSKIIFRSGNAEGADKYFSEGLCSVSEDRLEVILPYSSHRVKHNIAGKNYSLDDISVEQELEVIQQSKLNKKTKHLVESYISGSRDQYSIKAAYILRDTIKVIGTKEIPPASFGIFYDDLQKPMSGGTGHTIKICHLNKIPAIDQRIWVGWLETQNLF